ncbi:MAG: DUF2975 domain-containing protein [Lachnospiraceae bacterium]|nr:DUF2975 domain-containing protein [Lachnospiraceae bacterium]
MKEKAIQNVNKIGKVGNIIAQIMKVILIVGLVICVVATIALVVLPDHMIGMKVKGEAEISIDLSEFDAKFDEDDAVMIKEEIESGNADIDINGLDFNATAVEVGESGFDMLATAESRFVNLKDLFIIMLAATLTILCTLITTIFAGRLCKEFSQCETPFSSEVTDSMQKLALSLIPWCLMSGVAEGLVDSILSNKVSVLVGVDLGVVFAIVIILVLVQIFKYGAILQQESDETL